MSGCGPSYKIDKKNNEVIRETWDEGRGSVRTVIAGADAATFEALKLPGPEDFTRDKNHVYLHGILIPGAHPESFRRFNIPGEVHVPGGADFYYYRDSERVFFYPLSLGAAGFIAMLPDSDPESFRTITDGWSRDRIRVYIFDKGFVPRDIDSFEPMERCWSRDSKSYYWGSREVVGADRSTFHISEQQPWFASDRNHLFWNGWMIDGCDPQTFHITSDSSGHDDHFKYRFQELQEMNTDFYFQRVKVEKQPL